MSLPLPIGRQKEIPPLPPDGHIAVLGTAGSGKTTLAILRSAFLADRRTSHYGRTLLLTFNKALVTYLRHLGSSVPSVAVENYHQFARGYLASKGRMKRNGIIDARAREILIEKALAEVRAESPPHPILNRSKDVFFEEFSWIAGHGVTSAKEYEGVERVGRAGTRIQRRDRSLVFEVYERYKSLRSEHGKDYDWDDIATATREEFEADTSERMYKHIVIDEGQDFSPEMLRSLVCAVPNDGSLTFFGDVAQQIYGHRMSWRSAGMNVDKVFELQENYRNSKQIARLGIKISEMPYFQGTVDLVKPTTSRADGTRPTIVKCPSIESEIQLVVNRATRAAKTSTVAILFRDRNDELIVRRHLPPNSTRLHRSLSQWITGPNLFFGTYHAAKGLEFDMVILPFCTDQKLPALSLVTAFGQQDAMTKDGRLLYVGVTRARAQLLVTYTDNLSHMLPDEDDLYTRLEL